MIMKSIYNLKNNTSKSLKIKFYVHFREKSCVKVFIDKSLDKFGE